MTELFSDRYKVSKMSAATSDSQNPREICSGVVNESKTQSTCEQPSRATRRKRMEIRKVKFIAGKMVEEELKENGGIKRHKRSFIEETTISSLSPARDCENGVESIDYENYSSSNESIVETISILKSSSPVAMILVAMIPVVEDRCPKFGMSSVCGRRRDMEDAISIHPSFCKPECQIPARLHFFGVYDGHGCSHVATSCKQILHLVVKEEIENGCKEGSDLKWESIMEKSFSRVDKEVTEWNSSSTTSSLLLNASCRCEQQTPKCDTVGSTAVVSVVTPDKIIVSNCGDSRAVLCRGGKAVALSVDHKPDRPGELVRIQEAGGQVIYWDGPRVLGVLAMSRAIGDNYLKPYVISEPEITITDRTARQAALGAGLPNTVICTTINNVCASGMKAQSIQLGSNDVVIAGGMESMSNVPKYLSESRKGSRLGHDSIVDGMLKDGLWDVYNDFGMGVCAEICADHHSITREEQDAYAIQSFERGIVGFV